MLIHIFLTGQFIQSQFFEHGKYFTPKKKNYSIMFVYTKEYNCQNLIRFAAQQQYLKDEPLVICDY